MFIVDSESWHIYDDVDIGRYADDNSYVVAGRYRTELEPNGYEEAHLTQNSNQNHEHAIIALLLLLNQFGDEQISASLPGRILKP